MVTTSSSPPTVDAGWSGELRYQPGPDGHPRPYLLIEYRKDDSGWERIVALIDTGADTSVLPLSTSSLLGIDLADLTHRQGQQVVGSMDIWTMSGSVTARVSGLGNEFELNPVFVQSTQTPLLGRMAS